MKYSGAMVVDQNEVENKPVYHLAEVMCFLLKRNNRDIVFISLLPESFLDYFDLVSCTQLGNVSTKKMEFELHLDERNILPVGYDTSEYESKGFLDVT